MSRAILLGLFYSSVFVGTGASLPYMPVWFRAQGLSGLEIGVILSAPMLARIVISPVLAIWADGFALRRTPIMLFGLGAGVCYGLIGLVSGFGPWLFFWLAASSFLSTVIPLIDVLSMRRAKIEGFNYGLSRGIGSLAFVIANIGMGAFWPGRARADHRLDRLRRGAVGPRRRLLRALVHETGERPAAATAGARGRVAAQPAVPAGGGVHQSDPGDPRLLLRLLGPALAGTGAERRAGGPAVGHRGRRRDRLHVVPRTLRRRVGPRRW